MGLRLFFFLGIFFPAAFPLIAQDTLFANPWIIKAINKPYKDIELDEEDNFYLLDTRNHRLAKYYSNQGYDSMQTIGGKGLSGEGLNGPTRIRATNRQNLYLLDTQNRRLLICNTNLKILKEVNFLQMGSGSGTLDFDAQIWPVDMEIGGTGELFLLNQEDNKIYKVDLFGKLQTVFGGLDYGPGSLLNPSDMVMTEDNQLLVADSSQQTVKVFDLFGIYLYTIATPENLKWQHITSFEDQLICFNEQEAYVYHLFHRTWHTLHFPKQTGRILDVEMNGRILSLLTPQAVILYRIR